MEKAQWPTLDAPIWTAQHISGIATASFSRIESPIHYGKTENKRFRTRGQPRAGSRCEWRTQSTCLVSAVIRLFPRRKMLNHSDTAIDVGALPDHTESEAARGQLERILKHPLFMHSRRYPVLLRYVVEQTLEGNVDQIKERSIGVLVFGRKPTYDANADPIVRVTAGEIRKRLQQYYAEPEHAGELKIVLPVGSYVPKFETHPLAVSEEPILETKEQGVYSAPSETPPKLSLHRLTSSRRRSSIALIFVFLLFAASAWVVYRIYLKARPQVSLLDEFWSASPQSPGSVLLCLPDFSAALAASETKPVPDHLTGRRESQDTEGPNTLTLLDYLKRHGSVALADMHAATKVASVLAVRNRSFQIRLDSATTFADLREGPAILIGGFDNRWTMEALHDLPYSFRRDPSSTSAVSIVNVKNQSDHRWTFDFTIPFHSFARDFAIVARFPDSTTGQLTTVVAGIGDTGTEAAAELLSSEAGLISLSRLLKDDPAKVNFEAVISTEVIEGNPGRPVIVAIAKL